MLRATSYTQRHPRTATRPIFPDLAYNTPERERNDRDLKHLIQVACKHHAKTSGDVFLIYPIYSALTRALRVLVVPSS